MLPADFAIRSAGNMIVLPEAYFGKTKNIAVYDCSGKLLQKTVAKKNTVDLRKDFGLSTGVYIVKARVVR
jgi:hypothetical protein